MQELEKLLEDFMKDKKANRGRIDALRGWLKYVKRNPRDGHPGLGGRRTGAVSSQALATVGVSAIIMSAAEWYYVSSIDKVEERAYSKVDEIGLIKAVRIAINDNELPWVRNEFGLIKRADFTLVWRGELIKIGLEFQAPDRDTRWIVVYHYQEDGTIKQVIPAGKYPLSGG